MDDGFFSFDSCDLDVFRTTTSRQLTPEALTFAAGVTQNVPVYAVADLHEVLSDPTHRPALLAEWADVLQNASGVLVLKGAYADTAVIDEATAAFNAIIATEAEGSGGKGDHFAASGANSRIWNALQKLCLANPGVFARYFGNIAIAGVCEAWLGPFYQMTAQVNVVRPGGKAQQAHRDYHLGFQTESVTARFPAHIHDLSAVMTLQGAVAHCDMPVESGPTKLLPFSQLYRPGYLAYRRPEFQAYFEAHHIQLPLAKGDAVFFNPALFHAAGENRSADIERMANLLQVSSAFGRAMESVDRMAMCRALFPVLRTLERDGTLTRPEADAAIASAAEGYSFPTNLDTDPPVGGLAPETQAALVRRALEDNLSDAEFAAALDAQRVRQQP